LTAAELPPSLVPSSLVSSLSSAAFCCSTTQSLHTHKDTWQTTDLLQHLPAMSHTPRGRPAGSNSNECGTAESSAGTAPEDTIVGLQNPGGRTHLQSTTADGGERGAHQHSAADMTTPPPSCLACPQQPPQHTPCSKAQHLAAHSS
jgi:hypothetical protein